MYDVSLYMSKQNSEIYLGRILMYMNCNKFCQTVIKIS